MIIELVVEAEAQMMVIWARAVEWGGRRVEAFEILSGGRTNRTY